VSTDAVSTETLTKITAGQGAKPSAGRDLPYRVFTWAMLVAGGAIVVYFAYSIIAESVPGWRKVGWSFFTSTNWDPIAGHFGALALIVGTLLTTAIACLLAVPVGVGAALCVTYVLPRGARTIVSSLVELLAIVPSIIYGVWGYLLLEPLIVNTIGPHLQSLFHSKFPFNGLISGGGLLLGSVVLAVMILPTVAAITRDVFAAIPDDIVEAGLALGATKGQVMRRVVLPSSKSGILGASTLGAGRALGETIAMAILLGGLSTVHPIPVSLFGTAATLASQIAVEFGELTYQDAFNVMCCLAVTLMIIVAGVNLAARTVVQRNLRKLR
jgi:phosphate transport system permease protein